MNPSARGFMTPVLCALMLVACTTPAPAQPMASINAEEGIALQGYDAVAYFLSGAATPGLPEYRVAWGGATWQFASQENRRRFEADPHGYAPQYGGYCAYAMSIDRIADVDPKAWEIVDGKLYLNNNKPVHALWRLGKDGRIEKADAHWAARYERGAVLQQHPGAGNPTQQKHPVDPMKGASR